MADTQANTESKKAKAPQGASKGGKGDGPKGDAPKVKKPRERSDYVARLKTQFETAIRGELSKQFGYKNRMQVPVITKSRKSIATYKLRDGQAIGCKVTLRKTHMYDFIDRLVNIVLPRIRDFRGLNPKSFDGRGNFSLGIKEHIVFPEIDFDKVTDSWGLDITVCTSARNDEEARALLTAFNFPFRQ